MRSDGQLRHILRRDRRPPFPDAAIIRALTGGLTDAYDPAQTPDEVLSKIATALSEIATIQFGSKLVEVPTAVLAAMDRIEAITQRAESAGLFTGLQKFDESIGGLFAGELVVLTARSGVGKTALACQIVAHNAARERLTYVASLEMDAAELATRMLCTAAEVDGRRIRTNKLDRADYSKLTAAAEKLAKFSVRFDERPEITVADVRRATRRLLKDGLKLVVVDYLQIVTPDDPRENRERQVANMSKQLKALARELKVPVLVLCQSNRDAEEGQDGKPPSPARIRCHRPECRRGARVGVRRHRHRKATRGLPNRAEEPQRSQGQDATRLASGRNHVHLSSGGSGGNG